MAFLFVLLAELVILFFLSRTLTRHLSKFIVFIVRNRKVTIWFLSLLFLPGVVIHEISHLIMATVLFVRAGELELIPKITGDNVKLGSVQIQKNRFIRRSLIGFAPIVIGFTVLTAIFYYFLPEIKNLSSILTWNFLLSLYIIFQISNTMFSSRKDIEGTFKLILVLLSVFFALVVLKSDFILYLFKRINESGQISLIKNIDLFLLIPAALDILLISLLKLVLKSR
ncbi:MAG: hypothetical protein M1450_04245 [Patescibacteria group bacterium]|nr:hypothetical protein [Patescibacteria group bacterium]